MLLCNGCETLERSQGEAALIFGSNGVTVDNIAWKAGNAVFAPVGCKKWLLARGYGPTLLDCQRGGMSA